MGWTSQHDSTNVIVTIISLIIIIIFIFRRSQRVFKYTHHSNVLMTWLCEMVECVQNDYSSVKPFQLFTHQTLTSQWRYHRVLVFFHNTFILMNQFISRQRFSAMLLLLMMMTTMTKTKTKTIDNLFIGGQQAHTATVSVHGIIWKETNNNNTTLIKISNTTWCGYRNKSKIYSSHHNGGVV